MILGDFLTENSVEERCLSPFFTDGPNLGQFVVIYQGHDPIVAYFDGECGNL